MKSLLLLAVAAGLTMTGAQAGIILFDDFEGASTWTSSGATANDWALLSGAGAYSPTQYWGVNDPNTVHSAMLTSPILLANSGDVVLSFYHSYVLESNFDGGVVEISINGGGFTDVGGANFTQSGYNSTISNSFSSPIAGRQAFSGNSGGFLQSIVSLAGVGAGDNFQIRFLRGTDTSVSATGWFIDDVLITDDTPSAIIPEPSTLLLSGLGFVGLLATRLRRRS
jgi:hypothetical protein